MDSQTQDMFVEMFMHLCIIRFITLVVFLIAILIQPLIPSVIVVSCEGSKDALITQLALGIYMLIYFGIFSLVLIFFHEPLMTFSDSVAQKIYFWIYTTRGKALSKADFETIRISNPDLYDSILTQDCLGYCYTTCYELLNTLKKGEIEFVAIKKSSLEVKDPAFDGRYFKIHVLYINNGWAFDTYSQQQYPLSTLHRILKAKVYKSFGFNDICNKSFYEFRDEQRPGINEWCDANNCDSFSDRI